MGTNYYIFSKPCECCGRSDESLHIGKSSYGWCFGLHVMPWDGISDLPDWEKRFNDPAKQIKDEYGKVVTPAEMIDIITKRSHPHKETDRKFYNDNHAEPGPNNLLRSRIDGRHCTGHGAGTWDLLPGEFS